VIVRPVIAQQQVPQPPVHPHLIVTVLQSAVVAPVEPVHLLKN